MLFIVDMEKKGSLNREILEAFSKEEIIDFTITKVDALTQKVAELEARLNQNSKNSSRPPSSGGYERAKTKSRRKKSGRTPGAQPKHTGHGPKLQYEIIRTIALEPVTCPYCQGELRDEPEKRAEIRYVHDIPEIEVRTTVYVAYAKECPYCNEMVKGTFPAAVTSTQQYGPNIKALVVMLNQFGMMAINKIKTLLESVYGANMSVGSIAAAIKHCARELKTSQELIKEAVVQEKVVHFDETGMRNQGTLWWLHTASTSLLTFLFIHPKRGREAMNAAGVLWRFEGVAVHDCWTVYWAYVCAHALCNAHLLRELVGVLENTEQEWAKKMIELLVIAKQTVEEYREQGLKALPAPEQQEISNAYDALIAEGLELNPRVEKEQGKKGVVKQSTARNLIQRLHDRKKNYLLFTQDFDVPFDNNQAERDFRISKTKQKVSGSFRSDTGAKNFATIQSIIQTLRKHGANIWDQLVRSFRGQYHLPFTLGCD